MECANILIYKLYIFYLKILSNIKYAHSIDTITIDLTLCLWSFLLPSNWHRDIFFHIFTWHRVYFSMFIVWHTFFLCYHVSQAENWSSAPIYSKCKCIYPIFKAKNQEIQFPLSCTKSSIDKHKLLSFKGW